MALFKFHWYCGRNGDLDGLFVATQEEVDALIGQHVHFGEVLGKHSEVEGTIEPGDVKLISNDAEICRVLVDAMGGNTISGHNPLSYLEEDN